jgi:hypothetical protein
MIIMIVYIGFCRAEMVLPAPTYDSLGGLPTFAPFLDSPDLAQIGQLGVTPMEGNGLGFDSGLDGGMLGAPSPLDLCVDFTFSIFRCDHMTEYLTTCNVF